MSFKRTGDISTQNGGSLKLVDKFTYLGNSISSTEKWHQYATGERMNSYREAIIWKSDLSDKIKHGFFQAAVVSILLYGSTTWTLTKRIEKKACPQLYKDATSYIKQIQEVTSLKTAAVRPLTSHLESHPN